MIIIIIIIIIIITSYWSLFIQLHSFTVYRIKTTVTAAVNNVNVDQTLI